MRPEDPCPRPPSIPPNQLVKPALELHWAVQLVAAAGQTFAEPLDDDSHRAMSWDPELRALVGVPLAGPYPFRISVRPGDLTLQVLERSGEALGSLPLSGQTLEDGFAWLAAGLATYMGAPPRIERPGYELPPHPVADGARFVTGLAQEREALSALYGSSHALLTHVAASRADASPVLCWPHHFDIATLLTLERSDATKTVGVGMAPMGGGYDTWYWYVTPWPYPEVTNLPKLDSPGSWHTDGWVGAVLSGEHIARAAPEAALPMIEGFITSAIDAAATALSD